MAEKQQIKIKWLIQIKKTILLEKAYEVIKFMFTNFQDESVAKDMEVITLLRELAMVWDKDIDIDYDIDWEV